jgi:N-formylglutamate amidohydrolase
MELWRCMPGETAVIVNVPHCGLHLPPEIAAEVTEAGLRLPDTDWHVEKLYAFAPGLGVTLLHATHSRYVVDLNRDPGNAPLYPGADNTEVCPTRTFHNADIWRPGRAPSAETIGRRVADYWRPYHARLGAEVDRIRQRHGHCVLLDGHSIASEVPRFFSGRLPDLNLGTADGKSCAASLQRRAADVIAAAGLSHVVNGRFKGGYITRHYGRPEVGIHALQLEMATSAYLDEALPERYKPARAAPLVAVLQRLVKMLADWRPG